VNRHAIKGAMRPQSGLILWAVFCGLAGLASNVALGQAATAAASGGRSTEVEEIIVTAQKREESLQRVPVAVTALGQIAIENARIQDIRDISGWVPGLYLEKQPSGAGTPAITIRGISAAATNPALDNPIAVYIDGVYWGAARASSFEVADIKRVEVLRGPQGTLYGRNSTGGAINLITVEPQGKLALQQSVSAGNYDQVRIKTRLNLPEYHGLSTQISYLHDEQDGYVRNLLPGVVWDFTDVSGGRTQRIVSPGKLGGKNVDAFHLALRYAPYEKLTLDYKGDFTDSVAVQQAIQTMGFSAGAGGALARSLFSQQANVGGAAVVSLKRLDAVPNNMTTPEHLTVLTHSLTASYDIGDNLQLKNIAAYGDFRSHGFFNGLDGGGLLDPAGSGQPLALYANSLASSGNQRSEELQILGHGGRLKYVAGLFYFENYLRYTPTAFQTRVVPYVPAAGYVPTGNQAVHNSSFALYGQGTYNVTDRLALTAGVRSTWDRRRTTNYTATVSGTPAGTYAASFNNVDWQAIASYRALDELTTYAKVSTGFLSGGIANGIAFEPETITQYEIGEKAELWEKRLRLNVALYYSDYKDLQTSNFSRGFYTVFNAGAATVKGGEAEVTLVPVEGLTFGGSVGYTDFKYDVLNVKGAGGVLVNTAASTRRLYTPKWTASLSGQYDFAPMPSGAYASAQVEGMYRSDIYFAQTIGDAALDDALIGKAYWMVNARVSLADVPLGQSKGKLSLWGRNLLDKRELSWGANIGTVAFGAFMQPRTYGLDLVVNY
jgi:iron complex outermembrane receptor protein